MVPLCTASHLSRLFSFVFTVTLLICLFCQEVLSLLAYDRQTLLDIGAFRDLSKPNLMAHGASLPPFLRDIPVFLRRPPCYLCCKKCSRRWGKHGGLPVRCKAYLKSSCVTDPHSDNMVSPVAMCFLRTRARWIWAVLPGSAELDQLILPPSLRRIRINRRGVDHGNLDPVNQTSSTASEDHMLHRALLNARSIANKTFLLNDFFTSRKLDFMFLTETWLHKGELTPFSELLPPG